MVKHLKQVFIGENFLYIYTYVITSWQGEEMDEEALVYSFTTCSGQDCLKDLVPMYVKRIKVYMAIKRQLEVCSFVMVH